MYPSEIFLYIKNSLGGAVKKPDLWGPRGTSPLLRINRTCWVLKTVQTLFTSFHLFGFNNKGVSVVLYSKDIETDVPVS